MNTRFVGAAMITTALVLGLFRFAHSQELPQSMEGNYVVHEFHFRSGEARPQLRLHYYTLSQPVRDAQGHVANAVMIVHPTTVEGGWYLQNKAFAGELFNRGQLLDAEIKRGRFVLLPISDLTRGHGTNSYPPAWKQYLAELLK